MNLTLERFCYSPLGTFGRILQLNLYTVERPWVGNKREKSCVTASEYTCRRVDSPHFGIVFELQNVQDREHILIHKGNTSSDVRGCIAVGNYLGAIGNDWAVLDSAGAFRKLMEVQRDVDSFTLTINHYAPRQATGLTDGIASLH